MNSSLQPASKVDIMHALKRHWNYRPDTITSLATHASVSLPARNWFVKFPHVALSFLSLRVSSDRSELPFNVFVI